jgi:nucleoside triphosphate pyrophosphatase
MIRERIILVLASSSPRRFQLLEQIGLRPDEVIAAELDETPRPRELPRHYVERLARAKAAAVRMLLPDDVAAKAVVLGADTVVACGRRILPKAEDDATVTKCLKLLSGRRHEVLTAIAIVDGRNVVRTRTVSTKVAFRRLDDAEIAHYVEKREGLGKAGGYAVQGRAAVFARAINGSYTNVVGLPLTETYALLTACGLTPA